MEPVENLTLRKRDDRNMKLMWWTGCENFSSSTGNGEAHPLTMRQFLNLVHGSLGHPLRRRRQQILRSIALKKLLSV